MLLRNIKVKTRWLRTVLLPVGVGVALLPLVAVILKDLRFLPVFSALMATVLLAVWGGSSEPRAAPAPPRPSTDAAVPDAPMVRSPASRAERSPSGGRLPSQHILTLLHVLAALDNELIRLCELSFPSRQTHSGADARSRDIDDPARGD